MTRKQFLWCAAGSVAAPAGGGNRLNIVYILTDDHRWDMMGCAGPQLGKGKPA